MSDRITEIEEQLAHLTRMVEDLSATIARQDRELAVALRRIGMLMQREAERETDQGAPAPLADQKPPHW